MAGTVRARVHLLSTVYCVALLSFTAAGCVSSERTRSVGDAMRWDARHAPLPTARTHQLEDDVALPTLDESASLADYLAYAALNNPGLEAAFNLWKAALERVPQEKSLPDPRFTYRYFIREVETRVGPQKQGLGLSQMFPWFGKLELRGSVAAEAAEAARQRYENEKFKLFFEVKDAFYEYYYLGRAIDVVQENLELVEYLESVARARYKTASAGHPDVIRAQVEMGKLEDQVTSLRDLVVPVVARLNAVLNRTSTAKLPLPLSIPEEHMNIAGEEVLKRLARNSPVLRALDHEIDRARHAVALAKKNYYPDFTLGVDYTDVGSAVRSKPQGFSNPAALRSASRIAGGMGDLIDAYAIGKSLSPGGRPGDSGQDVWMVSLSMNVPIWRAKYAAGEREARARYLAALSARAQQENSLTATTQRTLFEHRDAGRKIALYRDVLIPKAKESIGSTETAFRAGSASFLDLVDAERSLLEFELSFERALANRAQRLAELEMLVGGTLSHGTEGTVEKSQPTKTPVDGRTTEVPEPKRPEEGTDKP
ncbi:MAG: TolC family protein [Planctomycetes bacterium]|nr:TolC family protein [Planctomycetota bacterium]